MLQPELPTPRAAWIAVAALGALLLYPALTPAHVEGFSASIVSLGLHIGAGDPAGYDRIFPVNFDFFGLSRLGVTLAVALLSKLGLSGEWAMRVTMWAGLVGLASASWVLVRRWAGAGGVLAAVALLLLPGAADSAFFYNDNMLSAALAVGSLAVLGASPRPGVAALAGLLFGAGMVTRADAVLLGAAVPLVLYEQHGVGRAFVGRGLAFAAGALVPVVALLGAFHATFLDVIAVSTYVVRLWERDASLLRQVVETAFFVGLPGAVLIGLGGYWLVRRREYHRLLLLAGVPLVFSLVNVGKLWETRQLLPLTPFFGALVALGWRQLAGRLGERRRPQAGADVGTRAATAWVPVAVFVAFTAFVWLAPVKWRSGLDDGPRALRGRVWLLGQWTNWQRAMAADVGDIRGLVVRVGAPRPAAIITDYWDADRYVHLALQEAGYTLAPAARRAPACAPVAELWERGDRRVLHVRLHVPFLQSWSVLAPERLDAYGAQCMRDAGVGTAYFVAPEDRVRELLPHQASTASAMTLARADSIQQRTGYDPHAAVALDSAALAELRREYAAAAERRARLPAPNRKGTTDHTEAERLLSAHVTFRP